MSYHAPFPGYCGLVIKFLLSTGGIPLYRTPPLKNMKFDVTKLEASLYRRVQNLLRYLEPFRHGSRV